MWSSIVLAGDVATIRSCLGRCTSLKLRSSSDSFSHPHIALLPPTMVEGVGGRSVIDRAWQAARSYTVSSFQELKAMDKTRFGLQAVNLGGDYQGCPGLPLCGKCKPAHYLSCSMQRCLPHTGALITTGLMIWMCLVLLTGSVSPVRLCNLLLSFGPTKIATHAIC